MALRKVRMLLDSGAEVTLISPVLRPGITRLFEKGAIHLIRRNYKTEDIEGSTLVIAAANATKINQKVAADAREAKIPVNAVDDPHHSDFIIPSYFRQGDLTVAVSTGGVSPALARKIRTKLEKDLGEEYALLVSLVGEVRSTIKEKKIIVDAEAWKFSVLGWIISRPLG